MDKKIKTIAIVGSIISTIYITIEYYRYRQFVKTKERLKNTITPLSDNFDNEKWFSFFTEKIQLLQPEEFKLLIENIFWNAPLKYIEYFRIIDALLIMSLGCEKEDMSNKWSEKEIEKYKGRIEKILFTFFNKNRDLVNNSVIRNHILLPIYSKEVVQKLNKPFIRIHHSKIHNLEPTPIFFPLPLTMIFKTIRYYGNNKLYFHRFVPYTYHYGITFWIKKIATTNNMNININTNKKTKSLLFFHGMGIGVVPYLDFIIQLCSLTKNEYSHIILIEMPGISWRNNFDVFPTMQQIANTIFTFMKMNMLETTYIDAIGHSYGTTILSYITNQYPNFLHKKVYIDGIVFFPGITKYYEFVFSRYTWKDILHTLMYGKPLIAISQLLFSELYNKQIIHNICYMPEYCNNEKNLDENTMIILGEKDIFVSSLTIEKYMKTYYPSVKTYLFKNNKHGDFLLNYPCHQQYLDIVSKHLQE